MLLLGRNILQNVMPTIEISNQECQWELRWCVFGLEWNNPGSLNLTRRHGHFLKPTWDIEVQ